MKPASHLKPIASDLSLDEECAAIASVTPSEWMNFAKVCVMAKYIFGQRTKVELSPTPHAEASWPGSWHIKIFGKQPDNSYHILEVACGNSPLEALDAAIAVIDREVATRKAVVEKIRSLGVV